MSMNITVRTDLYEKLKANKQERVSFSDVIDSLYQRIINLETEEQKLIPATIDNEGRFEQSRTLKGKNILYRIQETN